MTHLLDSIYTFFEFIGLFVFIFLMILYFVWLKDEGLAGGIKVLICIYLLLLVLGNM